ncbi:hypothetical protein RFI_34992, partial [Reticulomyxa filosa]
NRTNINYWKYKKAMSELKRKLKQEKQEFMIKSIRSLQEGNTKQLFSQFRSMNSNKREITEEEVIEALKHISMNKAQGPNDKEWWSSND